MKKIFCILTILVSMCASPAWCNTINLCRTHIPTFFEKHCDDEGYKIGTGLSAAPSYGQVDINTQSQTISIGCYKYKTSFDKLKKDIEKTCKIESNQIIELSGLSRPSNHVKKTGTPTSAPAQTTVKLQKAGSPLNTDTGTNDGFDTDKSTSISTTPTKKIENKDKCEKKAKEELNYYCDAYYGLSAVVASDMGSITISCIEIPENKKKKLIKAVAKHCKIDEEQVNFKRTETPYSFVSKYGRVIVQDKDGNEIQLTKPIQIEIREHNYKQNENGTNDVVKEIKNIQTDMQGNFKIENVRNNATIIFTYDEHTGSVTRSTNALTDQIIMKRIEIPSSAKTQTATEISTPTETAAPTEIESQTSILPLSGTITDNNGTPISDATVMIQGQTCNALTGPDGKWEITSCPSKQNLESTDTLVIKHKNHPEKTIILSEYQNGSTVNVYAESTAESTTTNTGECEHDDQNAKKAIYQDGKCTIIKCKKKYIPSEDGQKCEVSEGPCNADQLAEIKHATAGELKKNKCRATECETGFVVKKHKCVAIEDDKKETTEKKQNNNSNEEFAEEPKLSEEDSKRKIEELEKNAQAMKDKEQSTENKMLGAASMAATGIGAMQAASAYSEQQADEDAEQAMKAYLATFHCNYGGGINVKGGEKDVQLPGGNELVGLYSEYVNLANNLKVRKAALDIRPGIESESILDSATSGLYDDVSIGKTSGAFTSLARALMDPNGPDAIAWAKQKSDSESQFKSGLTMAGIGAIGGAVGNMIINKNAPKESSDEINAKYDKLKTKLEQDIAAIPPQTAPCPSGTSGSKYPNCTCDNGIFNPNTNACDTCTGGQVAENGECVCPSDKPLWDNANNQCIARPTSCKPQCTPTNGDHLIIQQDCSCTCSDGYDYQNGNCVCTGENKKEQDGKCITAEIKTEIIKEVIQTKTTTTVDNAVLPAGSLFKIGSAELLTQAQTALSTFVNGLYTSGYSNCKLSITGHTDPVGTEARNKALSTQRAESVKTYIEGLTNSAITSVTADGHGEDDCTCGTRDKVDTSSINYADREYSACKNKADDYKLTGNTRFAPCRRVEISADCQKTTTTTETTTN